MEKNNVIIYILCHNETKLNESFNIYGGYNWAKPILMKYQDYSFENAFWKQLYEIQNEWINCIMVGTLSFSSYKKINLNYIDDFIKNKLYLQFSYYNFFNTNNIMPSINTQIHPYFNDIWNSTINQLKLFNTTESFCNYWICKPILMIKFINWYLDLLLPLLINNKHIFDNANYNTSNNLLNEENLIALWGKPFYPNLPFILERINKAFFITNHSCVCFLSDNKLKKYYETINVNTFFIKKVIDIFNIVNDYQLNPIIIINENDNVDEFVNVNIPIFYYVYNNCKQHQNLINKPNFYFLFDTDKCYKYCTNNNFVTINGNYDNLKLVLSYSPRLYINKKINKFLLLKK